MCWNEIPSFRCRAILHSLPLSKLIKLMTFRGKESGIEEDLNTLFDLCIGTAYVYTECISQLILFAQGNKANQNSPHYFVWTFLNWHLPLGAQTVAWQGTMRICAIPFGRIFEKRPSRREILAVLDFGELYCTACIYSSVADRSILHHYCESIWSICPRICLIPLSVLPVFSENSLILAECSIRKTISFSQRPGFSAT